MEAMAAGEVSQEPEALNALVNLYLSADCQYHIGTPNSTWLRLMMMLAMAKLGHLPSYAFVGQRKFFTEQNGRWGFFALCDKPELYALIERCCSMPPDFAVIRKEMVRRGFLAAPEIVENADRTTTTTYCVSVAGMRAALDGDWRTKGVF